MSVYEYDLQQGMGRAVQTNDSETVFWLEERGSDYALTWRINEDVVPRQALRSVCEVLGVEVADVLEQSWLRDTSELAKTAVSEDVVDPMPNQDIRVVCYSLTRLEVLWQRDFLPDSGQLFLGLVGELPPNQQLMHIIGRTASAEVVAQAPLIEEAISAHIQ